MLAPTTDSTPSSAAVGSAVPVSEGPPSATLTDVVAEPLVAGAVVHLVVGTVDCDTGGGREGD